MLRQRIKENLSRGTPGNGAGEKAVVEGLGMGAVMSSEEMQELVGKYTGPIMKIPTEPPEEPTSKKGRGEMRWSDGVFRRLPAAFDDHEARKSGPHLGKFLDGHDNAAEIEKIIKSGSLSLDETTEHDPFEQKRRREAEALRLAEINDGWVVDDVVDEEPPGPDTKDYYAPRAPSAPAVVIVAKRKMSRAEIAARTKNVKAKEHQNDQRNRVAEIANEVVAALANGRKPQIGSQLHEAKAILKPSGGFHRWLAAHGISPSTARRLMKV